MLSAEIITLVVRKQTVFLLIKFMRAARLLVRKVSFLSSRIADSQAGRGSQKRSPNKYGTKAGDAEVNRSEKSEIEEQNIDIYIERESGKEKRSWIWFMAKSKPKRRVEKRGSESEIIMFDLGRDKAKNQ